MGPRCPTLKHAACRNISPKSIAPTPLYLPGWSPGFERFQGTPRLSNPAIGHLTKSVGCHRRKIGLLPYNIFVGGFID